MVPRVVLKDLKARGTSLKPLSFWHSRSPGTTSNKLRRLFMVSIKTRKVAAVVVVAIVIVKGVVVVIVVVVVVHPKP